MTHAARPRDRIVAESARQTLLILGAGGDLTARLLLPGLGSLLASDSGRHLDLLLLGSGRKHWDDQHWRRRVGDSFAAARVTGPRIEAVGRDARFLTADVLRGCGRSSLTPPARRREPGSYEEDPRRTVRPSPATP